MSFSAPTPRPPIHPIRAVGRLAAGAPPVDESSEDAAVAKVGNNGLDPGHVEGRNSASAPPATGGDLHVIRLVDQNEPGRGVAVDELARDRRVGRVAAYQAVRLKLKHVAEAGDCNGARVGRRRTLLDSLRVVVGLRSGRYRRHHYILCVDRSVAQLLDRAAANA